MILITNRQTSGILSPFIDACAEGGKTAQKTGREHILHLERDSLWLSFKAIKTRIRNYTLFIPNDTAGPSIFDPAIDVI